MFGFDWIKIISGGQSGADVGGLLFGLNYDIETEANAFKEFKPFREYQKLFMYKDYINLCGRSGNVLSWIKMNYVCNKRTYIENLRCRTLYNVKNSDITIIFIHKQLSDTRGSKLTVKYCKDTNKPYMVIWLKANRIDVTYSYYDIDSYSCDDISKWKIVNKVGDLDFYDIFINLFSIYNGDLSKKRKLIINIAGERNINEIRVLDLLREIFDDIVNPKEEGI